jgi:hypothetical protein
MSSRPAVTAGTAPGNMERYHTMAKTPKNAGTPWTQALDKKLKELAEQNTATRSVAHKLDRSTDAIYAHASEKNISLKPTNQSPYTRQKKG